MGRTALRNMLAGALLAAGLLSAPAAAAGVPGELRGRVTADGKGVAGVRVTDGRTIVQTDRRGRYRLPADREAAFVYLTLPDGYEIPARQGAALLYQRLEAGKARDYDFALQPAARRSERHRLLVVADPQVYFEKELDSVRRAAADMRRTAADSVETFGVVCGDIIGDITRRPLLFEAVRDALAESGVPFFYAVGNHDMDVDTRSNAGSKRSFEACFGPTYYSFDRGRIHYVVLDDVFFLARGYLYAGYLGERQLKWLEQDLAFVPHGSTVVVCLHIPTWSRAARQGEWGKEESNKVLNNRRALYALLAPYRAHILSAHEHYNENYQPAEHIFEHVHAPLSTLFWQTPLSMDGIPAGYGVYEADGDTLTWYWKAVDYGRGRQFTAYAAGEDPREPEAVTVNVWNYDPAWKVRWYENGVPQGEMERYTGYDAAMADYVERHRGEFVYKYIGAAPTEHLFRAVPSAPDAEVCVEVEDRFGNRYLWSAAQGYSCRLAAEAQAPQAAQSPKKETPKRELPKKESLKEPPQEGTAAPHAAE